MRAARCESLPVVQIMKQIRVKLLVAVLLGAGCWVTLLAQEDRRRGASRLPAPVTNTLHRLYPGAELRDVDEDGENGEDAARHYKVELRLAGKRGEAWLRLMPDGSLVELKEEREAEPMPEVVRKALSRAFPKGRVTEARLVTRTVVTYEVEMREGERRREVTLSPRGRILEVEKR